MGQPFFRSPVNKDHSDNNTAKDTNRCKGNANANCVIPISGILDYIAHSCCISMACIESPDTHIAKLIRKTFHEQSKTGKGKLISGVIVTLALVVLGVNYGTMDPTLPILPQIFQQFNPFFVVALTPVSLAVFGSLAKKGKEPSAPRKIGIGMVIAAVGFMLLAFGSFGLPTPAEVEANGIAESALVSPNWLISTYLVLTFAELFLSPMGISFVSKVAPPKYKGAMMGLWFVATAIGNYLVAIIGYLWGDMQLWMVWSVLIVCCLLSALFIFSIMKKLEKVAK